MSIFVHEARCSFERNEKKKNDSNVERFEIVKRNCEICSNMFGENEFDQHLCWCEYCQNEWQFSGVRSHMNSCGAQTEFCNRCNNYVPRMNFSTHVAANNCARPERNKKTLEELHDEVRNYIKAYR
jgi:hypothetical protein